MASLPPQATQLQAGDVVADRYRVTRLVGRGGMGEVYEALDSKLERRVALKLVVAAASSDARRRLEAEAKAVAALEHPGIVTLHDVLEHGDLVVLVLELVQGQSLRDLLDEGPFDLRTVARVISGVADALDAAHQRGFVHRDVKPDNVIMRTDGRTVLLDFGIAKAPARSSPLASTVTADGALLGTPAYLAPEQIRDEPVSPATDQFALAVTAYELCTGLLPWNAASVPAIIASIVTDAPRRFHEPPQGDDAAIDAVFARALHKEPEERYPSVSAFADALGEALASRPVPKLGVPTKIEDGVDRDALKEMRTLTGPTSTDLLETASSETATTEAAVSETASTGAMPPEAPSPKQSSESTLRAAPFPSRRFAWMAAAGALLVGAGLWMHSMQKATPPGTPQSGSSGAPKDAPSSAVSLPDELPASGATSEDDRMAYREALRALRKGDLDGALRQLDAIVSRSPDFAGAQLMRSYGSFMRAVDLDEGGRAAFRAASAKRGLLSERDAKLLDALAPSFLDPPRWRDSAERLDAFVRERPGDVLGWEVLGFARTKLGDYGAAELAFTKETELDPRAALAHDLLAQFAFVRHDVGKARALLDACMQQVPDAVRCRIDLSVISANTGHCADADREARDALAMAPASPRALDVRARATSTLGAPDEVVAAFLEKRRKALPKELVRRAEIEDAHLLAERRGDFGASLTALDSSLSGNDGLAGADVSRFALARALTLWETGEPQKASDIANDHLKLEATRPLPERGNTDVTGRMLMLLLEAGGLGEKEHAERRAQWLTAWRGRRTETEWKTEVGFDLWLGAYSPIEIPTAEQARAAIDASKELGIEMVPRGTLNNGATDMDQAGALGSLFFSAGRLDEAEKLLREASEKCLIVADQRARLALGHLLAKRGDEAGACATYALVEKDWGHAKPRSVTAEAARAAAKKLACTQKR